MAVICGGASAAKMAWDQRADNGVDRVCAVTAQEGALTGWSSSSGVVIARRVTSQAAIVDSGLGVYSDGVTDGSNTLTSASAPFAAVMTGLVMSVSGFGLRVIEQVTSPSAVVLSGPALAAGTGVQFATPVGVAAFADGQTGSLAGAGNWFDGVPDNIVYSPSAPFTADMVGSKITITGVGTREITSVPTANQAVVDGAAFGPADAVRFTLRAMAGGVDVTLTSAAAKTVAAVRVPRTAAPVIVRWQIAGRARRPSKPVWS